eukprot:6187415-Pleurochrysis_carterae.AAC.1
MGTCWKPKWGRAGSQNGDVLEAKMGTCWKPKWGRAGGQNGDVLEARRTRRKMTSARHKQNRMLFAAAPARSCSRAFVRSRCHSAALSVCRTCASAMQVHVRLACFSVHMRDRCSCASNGTHRRQISQNLRTCVERCDHRLLEVLSDVEPRRRPLLRIALEDFQRLKCG